MKEWYEVINLVWIPEASTYGSVAQLGAFASVVKYEKNGIEIEELMDNEDFAIVDEIVFTRFEEEK